MPRKVALKKTKTIKKSKKVSSPLKKTTKKKVVKTKTTTKKAKTLKKPIKKTTKKVNKKPKTLSKPKIKKLTKKQIELEEKKELEENKSKIFNNILAKHKPKIKEIVQENQKKGFISKDYIIEFINETDEYKKTDSWNAILEFCKLSNIDVIEEEGLLKKVVISKDSRFLDINMSSYDSIQMYLRDIGRYPLLTTKEEKELGEKILLKRKLLSGKVGKGLKPAEKKLIIKEGKEARNKLAISNLRLVVSVAKIHVNRSPDLNLLDLVQEGADGLYKAIDKFDVSKGYKFSTYATWWIRQSIVRGLADKSRTIRVPVHMSETKQKYSRVVVRLEQDLGRKPTTEEIAEEMEVDVSKVYMLKKISQDVEQLDKLVGGQDEDGGTKISDTIADEGMETSENLVSKEILKSQIDIMLEDLPKREKDVIRLRHGMEDGVQYTLEEIGKKLGVTRERIRQIESKALEKIRRHEVLSKIKDY